MDIISAHKFSSKHHDSIMKSEKCGCFYCLAIFSPNDIDTWVDEYDEDGKVTGQTALCPKCSIDSVVGSNDIVDLNKEFLKAMKDHWFG